MIYSFARSLASHLSRHAVPLPERPHNVEVGHRHEYERDRIEKDGL